MKDEKKICVVNAILISIIVIVIGILTILIIPNSRLNVIIESDGTLYYLRTGWFRNEKFPIKIVHSEWNWLSPEGYKQIAVPYESKYNDRGWILVLDRRGRIYIRNKERTQLIPLKAMDGTWYRHENGEWLEVPFDIE